MSNLLCTLRAQAERAGHDVVEYSSHHIDMLTHPVFKKARDHGNIVTVVRWIRENSRYGLSLHKARTIAYEMMAVKAGGGWKYDTVYDCAEHSDYDEDDSSKYPEW